MQQRLTRILGAALLGLTLTMGIPQVRQPVPPPTTVQSADPGGGSGGPG